MPQTSMLDDVANDLALWIDTISTQIATAFVATRAPFAATTTEEQKLEFYRTKLFNPDGTPNPVGREAEFQRLGSDGFIQVYKAVIKRWPDLRIPTPEADVQIPDQWPGAPGGPPGPPGAPPGLPGGPPPAPGGALPPSSRPQAAALPPRPPMMPPPGR